MIKLKINWPRNLRKKNILYPNLYGNRIYLSVPKLVDYSAWEAVRRRNQDFLKPYEPKWAKHALSKSFFKRRLKKQHKEMDAGRGIFFLIHHRESKNIIGGINLNNIQYGAACYASLGYWMDKDLLRQGYMSEATNLVIAHAFNHLKLYRLNAACLPGNLPSINMLLKLGFEEEGFAKKYLQINGKWKDHRLFGLINPKY